MMITPEQEEMIDAVIDEAGNVANSFEWGSGSEKSRADLAEARTALITELARLNADNARMRNIISDAEWNGRNTIGEPCCPWCERCEFDYTAAHTTDCPAFTPEGVVK